MNSYVAPNHITSIEQATGTEPTELDTSSTSESDDDQKFNRRHAWCYVDRNQCQMDNFSINKKGRERRQMKNRVWPGFVNNDNGCLNCENDNVADSDNIYPGFYNPRWSNAKEGALPSNPLNCFTIINNELADSESSSDKENGIEIIQCGDMVLESNYWNNKDNNIQERKYENSLDNSKRTIWIYSFKNKNILCEDVSKPVNCSSNGSSSSSLENYDYEKVKDRINQDYRIATPTSTYIPRINVYVAATLPTVTEITEPYQFAKSDNIETITSAENSPIQLECDNDTFVIKNPVYKDPFLAKDQEYKTSSTLKFPAHSIINWMALSPRENRRFRKIKEKKRLSEEQIKRDEQNNETFNRINELINDNAFRNNSGQQSPEADHDVTYLVSDDKETDGEAISIERNINKFSMDEKGDNKEIKKSEKSKTRLENLLTDITNTGLIEKFNDSIDCKKENKEHIFDVEKTRESMAQHKKILHCGSDRLLSKHISLLKPVKWSENNTESTTGSTPSLHLSIPSDINEEKQSWFKRFIKCILCCKKV